MEAHGYQGRGMAARNEILVGIDGSSQATNAVLWAADEAARHGAVLRIITAHAPWYDLQSAPTQLKDAEERECRANLQAAEQAALHRQPDLAVRTELRSGEAAEVLGEQSGDARAVITGTRGRGGFPGLMLGSTTLALMGHARAPVIIVPGAPPPAGRGVVVGVDGSEASRLALGYAFEQARLRRVALTALWVIREPSWYGAPGADSQWLATAAETTEEQLVAELTPWRREFADVDVTETVVWGNPVAMLRQAGEDSGLLVVGNRGRSIARSMLLGSVSHGVLHHAPCPVAIVR